MNEDHRRVIIRRGDDGLPIAKIPGDLLISNEEALDGVRKVRAGRRDDSVKDDEP